MAYALLDKNTYKYHRNFIRAIFAQMNSFGVDINMTIFSTSKKRDKYFTRLLNYDAHPRMFERLAAKFDMMSGIGAAFIKSFIVKSMADYCRTENAFDWELLVDARNKWQDTINTCFRPHSHEWNREVAEFNKYEKMLSKAIQLCTQNIRFIKIFMQLITFDVVDDTPSNPIDTNMFLV